MFSAFAGGEEYFTRDTSIDVKADMCLRLLCASTIIRLGHGEDDINQETIEGHELTEFRVLLRQHRSRLFL
ncbi:MAG: hypothetical protein EHM86_10380 [Desulfobulbaceae bacterium]|nr:MAG: hypothetical protein EHM86_10380 [Desulfobulbaceae bacterium]